MNLRRRINVLPAIDLIDGNVVRLHQGDYNTVYRYQMKPVEAALSLMNKGFGLLHIIDLEGAKKGEPVNTSFIKSILKKGARLQVGGGIRTLEAVSAYLDLGVERVIVGTAAISNSQFWNSITDKYPKERVMLSLDVKDGLVATHGWEVSAQTTIEEVVDRIGIDQLHHLIVTDISKDGTLSGPNLPLYKNLKEKYPTLNIIPAGGVTTIEDLHELENIGIEEAIMGRVIYEKPELFGEVTYLNMSHKIDWVKVNGLLPVIIQSDTDGAVLMLGYMNKEALHTTIRTSRITFYSRTRKCQWTKGETSGNTLIMKKMAVDCDGDTLLITAEPQGPVCHTGTQSCFFVSARDSPEWDFINKLQQIIQSKCDGHDPASYIYNLFQQGNARIAQKVGEEGVETAIASVTRDREGIIEETADLFFHMLVNLRFHEIGFHEVISSLEQRNARRCEENGANQ